MKYKIANLITAISAEHIKKRGTGFYWTSVIFGLISPLLYFIVLIVTNTNEIKDDIPFNYYLKFIEESATPFAYFFFPLFIIIMVSRITQIDHKNGGWQLMETQPISKFSIYFAKLITILIANALAIVSYLFFSIVLTYMLTFILDVPANAIVEIPFLNIIEISFRFFVAALLVTAIQYFISVLITSFIWSILIGFFGLLLTSFLTPFKLTPIWYPYEIIATVATTTKGSQMGHYFLFTEYVSFVASIMLLYIGFVWYKHKQFKLAFVGNLNRPAFVVIIIIITCGGLLFWILNPKQMNNYSKTIICGKIESNVNFKNIYIRDAIVNDTIATIPIINNKFHYHITKKVVPDYYEVIIDGRKYLNNLFFGVNDSINIIAKLYANNAKFEIKGTRLAENQMNSDADYQWSMVEYQLQQNTNLEKPDNLIKGIYSEWEDAIAKPNKFRTIDNYIAKADFTTRSEKLITTKYLNLWNDLIKKRLALYPNLKTVPTAGIIEMQSKLPLDDESLLSNEQYFDFVRNQLILRNTQDIDDNAKAIAEISKLKPSNFKDKLLYWQVRKSLEDATSSSERMQLLAANQTRFSNKNFQRKIGYLHKSIESLGKGKVAPEIAARTIDGKAVKLSDLKGKYVAIDVWATWCSPCKVQTPYFEKLALKFKKEKIYFVGLCVDEDNKKWYIDAKNKTKSIQQWHVNDKTVFSKSYNINSIPRFILIDPNGKIVNSKMPQPSDFAFEIILRKELNLQDEE